MNGGIFALFCGTVRADRRELPPNSKKIFGVFGQKFGVPKFSTSKNFSKRRRRALPATLFIRLTPPRISRVFSCVGHTGKRVFGRLAVRATARRCKSAPEFTAPLLPDRMPNNRKKSFSAKCPTVSGKYAKLLDAHAPHARLLFVCAPTGTPATGKG